MDPRRIPAETADGIKILIEDQRFVRESQEDLAQTRKPQAFDGPALGPRSLPPLHEGAPHPVRSAQDYRGEHQSE